MARRALRPERPREGRDATRGYASVTVRLFDSLTRELIEVSPADGETVKIYSCGPTVYRYIHIGNMRSFMLGDLIRRALRLEGRRVRWIMNITDVGHMTDDVSDAGRDKMELAEADEGLSAAEIAEKYTTAFLQDADLVGIERADLYPRATHHIDEMIEIIRTLIDKGHAYEVDGTVYYDVTTFPGYGRLSGNTLDQLRAGHRQEVAVDPAKRHPEDFALWKKAGPNRALKWPSPWGEGFPGWHIECSAMSMKHLGERFDVHTGGNDNKFPHHEDEIAQSEGAVGHQVVSIWVHGGFLQMSGQKMAKSAKNIYRVTDLAEQGIDPLAYRLLCFGTQYRSEMDFSWEALQGQHRRLRELRRHMAAWGGPAPLSDAARAFDSPVPRGRRRRPRPAARARRPQRGRRAPRCPRARGTPCSRRGTSCSGSTSSGTPATAGSRPRRCSRWWPSATRPAPPGTTRAATSCATGSSRWASRSWTAPEGTTIRPRT